MVFASVALALLDFVGVAALVPVLLLILSEDATFSYPVMRWLYEAGSFTSFGTFVTAVCVAVLLVIIVKSILTLTVSNAVSKYLLSLYRHYSTRMFDIYLSKGLLFIRNNHTSQLINNVNGVCLRFTDGVLGQLFSIVTEIILLGLVAAALLWYDPRLVLLALAVFLPSIWLYYGLVRNRINRYGELENKAQREKARLVAETFRGYADIEINNAFPMMLRQFDRAMDQVIRTRLRETAIGLLPQTFTEVGLAVGMALLVALSLGDGDGRAQMLFGVFAVAALRLMPSVRNIMTGWTAIKYNRYTIGILRGAAADCPPAPANPDCRDTPGPRSTPAATVAPGNSGNPGKPGNPGNPTADTASSPEKLPFRHEIAVRDLRFRFADGGRELFHGLSLTIRKGERIGIRGASGAGKTTLFNLLLGLYEPTGGEIVIDGTPLTAANRRAWQNRIGYVSQSLFIADGSFAANVALGIPAGEVDRERVMQALRAAQLGELVAGLAKGIDTHVGECGCRLSGGQRQRIGIARALYRQADVLFFDEATSALDSRTEEEINRSIAGLAARDAGLTLVVIAHRESSLEYCNRIITIGE